MKDAILNNLAITFTNKKNFKYFYKAFRNLNNQSIKTKSFLASFELNFEKEKGC